MQFVDVIILLLLIDESQKADESWHPPIKYQSWQSSLKSNFFLIA